MIEYLETGGLCFYETTVCACLIIITAGALWVDSLAVGPHLRHPLSSGVLAHGIIHEIHAIISEGEAAPSKILSDMAQEQASATRIQHAI